MAFVLPKRRTFCWAITLSEYQTEENEERWVAVGATRTGRILDIVFAIRGEAMRPITGWAADKRTAELFLKQWGQG